MSTETRQPAQTSRRLASREELTRFYTAIGIPAVVSAIQASKMSGKTTDRKAAQPAFLKDAQAIG